MNDKKKKPVIQEYDLVTGKKAITKMSLDKQIETDRFIDLLKKNLGFYLAKTTQKAVTIDIFRQVEQRFEDFKESLPVQICLFPINTPQEKGWGYLSFDGNLLNTLINTSFGAGDRTGEIIPNKEKLTLTRFEVPIIENTACSLIDEMKNTLDSIREKNPQFSLSPHIHKKQFVHNHLPNQEYIIVDFAVTMGPFGGLLSFAFKKTFK